MPEIASKHRVLIALLLALGACMTPQRFEKGDPGPYPKDHRRLIEVWLNEKLAASYTISELEVSEPVKGAYFRGIEYGGGYRFAYHSCAKFAAAGKAGNYRGLTLYDFYIRDGMVIEATVSETGFCQQVREPSLAD
ncbi:MAG: hypothetical protein ACREUA_09895, partial [Burkholderiales bacterium]